MIDELMRNAAVVLKHIVILAADGLRNLLGDGQDLGEGVVGDIVQLGSVVLGDDKLGSRVCRHRVSKSHDGSCVAIERGAALFADRKVWERRGWSLWGDLQSGRRSAGQCRGRRTPFRSQRASSRGFHLGGISWCGARARRRELEEARDGVDVTLDDLAEDACSGRHCDFVRG